jgi:hypothetical protein
VAAVPDVNAYDGELLGAVTRVCVSTILGFYTARMKRAGVTGGQSGAVVVVQRTSSDLKLNPHLHIVFLDGVYRESDANGAGSPSFAALPHLSTREVGEVLASATSSTSSIWTSRDRSSSRTPHRSERSSGFESGMASEHAAKRVVHALESVAALHRLGPVADREALPCDGL